MIPAGAMRERITIESAAETQDAAGQVLRSWSAWLAGVPAKAEATVGGETLRGRQVSAETRIVFSIRYVAGVSPLMRVVWSGGVYGIVNVSDPYGHRRELRIECRATNVGTPSVTDGDDESSEASSDSGSESSSESGSEASSASEDSE